MVALLFLRSMGTCSNTDCGGESLANSFATAKLTANPAGHHALRLL